MAKHVFATLIIALLLTTAAPLPVRAGRLQGRFRADRPLRQAFRAASSSLYGAHTENLFSLGLSREIAGVSGSEDFRPKP